MNALGTLGKNFIGLWWGYLQLLGGFLLQSGFVAFLSLEPEGCYWCGEAAEETSAAETDESPLHELTPKSSPCLEMLSTVKHLPNTIPKQYLLKKHLFPSVLVAFC